MGINKLIENIKLININDTFSLSGDKFMPEMHLRQPTALNKPRFAYSACGSFTRNKERIQKI